MKLILDNNSEIQIPQESETEVQAIVFKILFPKRGEVTKVEYLPKVSGYYRARKKNVPTDRASKPWTPEEEANLKIAYDSINGETVNHFAKRYGKLIGRSRASILSRISFLKMGAGQKHNGWTPAQEEQLKQQFTSKPIGESISSFSIRFSEQVGKNWRGTVEKIRRLGL